MKSGGNLGTSPNSGSYGPFPSVELPLPWCSYGCPCKLLSLRESAPTRTTCQFNSLLDFSPQGVVFMRRASFLLFCQLFFDLDMHIHVLCTGASKPGTLCRTNSLRRCCSCNFCKLTAQWKNHVTCLPWMAVWRSGNALVNLRWSRLVVGWVTVSGFDSRRRHFISVC